MSGPTPNPDASRQADPSLGPEASAAARVVADRMADAAEALLASLDGPAGGQAGWPWTSGTDAERRRWFYTPTDHGGLAVADMAPRQYRRTMALLATGLSEAGYGTATTIMGLENILDRAEDFAGTSFARERGRDPGQYRVRVFGKPGDAVWGWRFGGHHVSVNNLVLAGRLASTTPCFLGADPATSPLLGGTALRPIGAVEDLARALVRSLGAGQLARTVLTVRAPIDMVTANRSTVGPGNRVIPLDELFRDRFGDPELDRRMNQAHRDGQQHYGITEADHQAVELGEHPSGLAAASMDAGQRELLRALLRCYTGRAPEEVSRWHEARYADSGLDAVHFAWAGSLETGQACYYRLHGPRLLVEYDNAQRQANHAHSVWRDPANDFGADVLAAHHQAHHG
jgi:hypothetical protein